MMTERVGQATDLARQAVADGCTMLVAVGGDGTVNEVVNGLLQEGVPSTADATLGIVPLGSGCDLARTLGLSKDGTEAIRALEGAKTRKLDVGRVDFVDLAGHPQTRHFINIADLGAGGLVVQKASRAPWMLGPRPNYVWGIITAAAVYRARKVRLAVDGGPARDLPIRNTIIANGRYFGRGFLAAPDARMDDGLFDIVTVGNFGTFEGIWHLPKLRWGKHLGLKKVDHCRGRRVEVTTDEDVLLEMDGDLVGKLPATFEILPGAVKVTVS